MGTQNNAIDDNIRHFDKQIDRDDSENLESVLPDDELIFLVINVKGYAVKFKFDNVYSCCPGARVSDTECDHIRALQACMNDILNNMNNETFFVFRVLTCDVSILLLRLPRRNRRNRGKSSAIFGRQFFFSDFECECLIRFKGGEEIVADSKQTKTRRNKNPNASSSAEKL